MFVNKLYRSCDRINKPFLFVRIFELVRPGDILDTGRALVNIVLAFVSMTSDGRDSLVPLYENKFGSAAPPIKFNKGTLKRQPTARLAYQ